MSRLLSRYTSTVLEFEMQDKTPATAQTTDALTPDATKAVSLFKRSRAANYVLFGLGHSNYPEALAAELPDSARLVVCETNAAHTRDFLATHPDWNTENENKFLITDTSAWALIYLMGLSNITTETSHTALCPDLDESEKTKFQAMQRLFVKARSHQAINSSYLSHVAVQAPDLSVGVILKPDEPGLDTFFLQFPDWIKEIVVVWDASEVPDKEYACTAPIRHMAHPLEDFADQRNRMLDACEGEWVLYLDGDERFSEDTWALFTALLLIKRLEACYFPRVTLYPDEQNVKVGFGLWPDLQLRLFKNKEGVRFDRPVHEKLTGVTGRTGLVLDAPILHYSRLTKSSEELTEKLKRFDKTGDLDVVHRLNDDYPHLERSVLPETSFIAGAIQVLLLEENPA